MEKNISKNLKANTHIFPKFWTTKYTDKWCCVSIFQTVFMFINTVLDIKMVLGFHL